MFVIDKFIIPFLCCKSHVNEVALIASISGPNQGEKKHTYCNSQGPSPILYLAHMAQDFCAMPEILLKWKATIIYILHSG